MARTSEAASPATASSRTRDGRTARAQSPERRPGPAPAQAGTGGRAGAGRATPMSSEHKAALAAGRAEGRAVRRYLEALERHKPRRGRRRTPDSISRRLSTIEHQLASADPLTRLHLLKERDDLEAELERSRSGDDLAALEKGFVKVAKSYGDRKGISYSVWRAAGVPPAVLQRAGVIRGGGRSGS